MARQSLRIFVSATTADLGTYRKAVAEELLTRDVTPVQQDHFAPSFRTVQQELGRKIRSCDAMICLVGKSFGEEPRNRPASQPRQSYTQTEYRLAKQLRKPVYVFLASEECPLDGGAAEEPEKALLQKAYRHDLRKDEALYNEFHDKASLIQQIGHIDFTEIRPRSRALGLLVGAVVVVTLTVATIAVRGNWDSRENPGTVREEHPPAASPAMAENPVASPAPSFAAQSGAAVQTPTARTGSLPEGNEPPVSVGMAASYRAGEKLELTVTAHRPGFLYVGAAWADGSVYLLYPNFHSPKNGDNRVMAGQVLRLPGDLPAAPNGAKITYPMEFPESIAGEETTESIVAFIRDQPMDLPDAVEDLGPAFRRLGMLKDPGAFQSRGPKPRLEFQDPAFSLGETEVVVRNYTLKRR